VVVGEDAAVRLRTASVQAINLGVSAPVTQVTLGDDGETVPRLDDVEARP